MHASDIAYKLRKQHNQLSLHRRILDKCEMEYRGEQLFLTTFSLSARQWAWNLSTGVFPF